MSSLNNTPSGERLHIAVFGRRNAGKSSLVNALTGQTMAIVSEVPGTTTDPVSKAMELLPLGPVVVTDTAGLDDSGSLGELRVARSLKVLGRADLALLVVDPLIGIGDMEEQLVSRVGELGIPMVVVVNKQDELEAVEGNQDAGAGAGGGGGGERADCRGCTVVDAMGGSDGDPCIACSGNYRSEENDQAGVGAGNGAPVVSGEIVNSEFFKYVAQWASQKGHPCVPVSASNGINIDVLKETMVDAMPAACRAEPTIVGDLIHPGDVVVLVVPIDKAAPKGRLILPQVMTIRDILDHDACAMVVKERELAKVMERLTARPRLVVTDSQAFLKVAADTPRDVLLTGFSILMARYKGELERFVGGLKVVDRLQPGDRVLISEGCTHHRQADDIGNVQIPRLLRQKVGSELQFGFSSGMDFPADVASYKLIIHCGACTLTRRDMMNRQDQAEALGVPMTNYGLFLAWVHGILDRALEPFPAAHAIWHDKNGNAPLRPPKRIRGQLIC